MPKIGVFDSGVGGLSVATAIQLALPDSEILFVNDAKNLPYGNKSPEQLLTFVTPIFTDLVKQGCEVIVIACNTVTTTLLEQLREFITIPLVGVEPMVEHAADLTKAGVIAVCATPGTLKSERYRWLRNTYAKGITVLEPDCSEWAYMIEHNALDHAKIFRSIETVCQQGADVIVLGCTHYHWIEELIVDLADGRATVLQPEATVVKQLQEVLATLS